MYKTGDYIIYGAEGVCRVESVGTLAMKGAKSGVWYYTLMPVYREGSIYAPVDTAVYTRHVMTKSEALDLIGRIPTIEGKIVENKNPRLLNEQYKVYLKSGSCMDLVRLIRMIYAKGRSAAKSGKRLGQTDERSMKRAEEMLHNELAFALGIRPDEVKSFIADALERER